MNALQSLDLGLEGPTKPDLEFVYVGDPMCSWCWGSAPTLTKLQEQYPIPLRVVMGGLRTGANAEPMDAEARRRLATYWEDVAQRTGQPFSTASLERDGWRYDTEPSCRAVVTMRELTPHDTLRWVARLHRAFYVEGVDLTDPTVFPHLLGGFDVDRGRFAELFADDAIARRTRQDVQGARLHGATGFPTVLLRDGEEFGIVARGFVPWDQLEPALTRWLEERYGDLTSGLFCDPDTGAC